MAKQNKKLFNVVMVVIISIFIYYTFYLPSETNTDYTPILKILNKLDTSYKKIEDFTSQYKYNIPHLNIPNNPAYCL